MADERPVPDKLLDYFLYAPLGVAVLAADELPRLAERGRERFEKRIGLASSIGKFAVAGALQRLKVPASSEKTDLAQPRPVSPASLPTDETVPSGTKQATRRQPNRSSRPRQSRSTGLDEASQAALAPIEATVDQELPIPAYGTLAASQVVERLASLTPSELEAVRSHETATRRRRTVLHRIAQLSSERGGVTA